MQDDIIGKPMFQVRLLAEVIVYKLYEVILDDDAPDSSSLNDIQKMFTVTVPRKLIENSLIHLKNFSPSLISRSGKQKRYMYKITTEGIIFVENALKKPGSLIDYYSIYGDENLDDVAGIDAIYRIVGEQITKMDWAQVKIDKESNSYQEALAALDEAIEAVSKHNEFQANYSNEREEILDSLRNGRSRLTTGIVTRHSLDSYILSPLKWIASTFAKGAMSSLATSAAQKILQLIAHFF